MLRSPEQIRRGAVALAAAISVLGSSSCSALNDSPERTATFTPLESPVDTTPIHLQLVDAEVSGQAVDEKPEITLEKDQYFEVYKKAGPASVQEIIEAVEKATSGRYVPSAVTTEVLSEKAKVSTCFDRDDQKQLKALGEIARVSSATTNTAVVLNAEICPTKDNFPVAGFAVNDGLTVLGRGAFVGGRFPDYLVHEISHQKNNAPHSGEALCEDPVKLKNCKVDAEGNIKSLMSYDQTSKTPKEYKGILTGVDLYKKNLLHENEVVQNPEIGTTIKLSESTSEGVKIVVDTSGEHTVYFVMGREPEIACKDIDSDTSEAGTYVATTSSRDSSNGNEYICRAPKNQEFSRSLDVYFDANTKIDTVHAVDIQDATTAIVNTEEFITSEASAFASQTELYRPVAKSLSTGRIYDSGTKVYEVVQDEAGNFVMSVSAS